MPNNQRVVQSAAALVDDGKAGTLSRLDEILAFVKTMNYATVGVAYCYGMELEAASFVSKLRKIESVKILSVSCTTGATAQNEVNSKSCVHNVSCNPIAQAEELNIAKAQFVITMGLCLGHDVLFNRYIKADHTTFVVKDRTNNHNPIAAL